MHPNIEKVARAESVADVAELFRCGFELETQETEGYTANDETESSGEIDYDRLHREARSNVTYSLGQIRNACEYLDQYAEDYQDDMQRLLARFSLTGEPPRRYRSGERLWRWIFMLYRRSLATANGNASILTRYERSTALAAFWRDFPELRELILEQATQTESERLEEDNSSDYEERGQSALDHLRDNCPDGLEVDTDGSVEGFEFRTEGPRTIAEFQAAARAVFRMSHDIDTKCSFHVHLSVVGVNHSYGAKLQNAMMAYLARNVHRVPSTVLERWANEDQVEQYFKVHLANPKYSFIHWHSQGSIEFRCFGNVQNAADGMTCLTLAMECLQFAYRCKLGLEAWPEIPLAILRDDLLGRTDRAA